MLEDAKTLKEGWKLVDENIRKETKRWVRKTQDGPQEVTEIRADGITPQLMRKYRANWASYVKERHKVVTCNQLASDGGAEIYHYDVKLPWPLTDRTFYMAVWSEDDGDDITTICTTEGNEHIVAANTDKTRKNVLGTTQVDYFQTRFDSDKVCRWLRIRQGHFGGNLHKLSKSIATKEIIEGNVKETDDLIDFIVNKMP